MTCSARGRSAYPSLIRLLTVALGALMLPNPVHAEGLTVVRTVYLERGAVVDPKAIVRARDNGLIVAGSIDLPNQPRDAWAIKTDAEGNVLWRYTVPLREKLNRYDGPEFSSVAIMPDDSIFLCGRMPFVAGTGKSSPALISHLSKNGKVLSEKLFYPQNGKPLALTQLNSCASSGDGIVAVGHTTQFVKNPSHEANVPPNISANFYLIVSIDSSGEIKWEKLLPVSSTSEGFDYVSPLQATWDGGFVFAASRWVGTRIIRLNASGEVTASRMLADNFILMQSAPTDHDIHLLSSQTESLTHLTLDNDLKEVGRLAGEHTVGEADVAYLLPDRSLMIFGAKHDRDGLYYGAQVMHVNAELKSEKTTLLGEKLESGWSRAGVPLSRADEFVSIRTAINPKKLGANRTAKQLQEGQLGAAMDFIQLKKL